MTDNNKTANSPVILAKTETKFNLIYVIQTGDFREIWFKGKGERDFFLQSRINLQSPFDPELVYSQMMMASLFLKPNPKRILMIGLGAAVVSNFMHHQFSNLHLDVVEIDPMVLTAAKKYFFLKESPRYKVHILDGRVFLKNQIGGETYDMVFLDAFKSGSVPYHLKTVEFYREIKAVLCPDGLVCSNLYGKSNEMKPSDRKSFQKVFSNIYTFEDPDRVATVLLAQNGEKQWSAKDFRNSANQWEGKFGFSMKSVASYFKQGQFAPDSGSEFKDDFTNAEFARAVEKNNSNDSLYRPYPIQNTH